MANDSFRIKRSLNLQPISSVSLTEQGDIGVDSADNKLKVRGASTTDSVVQEAQAQTLTNKTIDSDLNTLSNIVDANIKAGAAIAYAKLALTGSIVNADIAAAAAIAYTKLSISNSIVNSDIAAAAAIVRSKIASGVAGQVLINDGAGALSSEAQLDRTRGGTGLSSTATFPASGVIATDTNTLSFTNKVYDAEGLGNTILNITDAAIKGGASIDRAKLSGGFAEHVLINSPTGVMSSEALLNRTRGGTGVNSTATFPTQGVITTDAGVSTLTNKTIDADGIGNSITNIEDADIKTGASIQRAKLASGTNNHVVINNGSGEMSSEALLDRTRGGTGITSTATFPSSGVITTDAGTSTLTNKTVISPVVDDGLDFIEETTLVSPSAGRRRLGLKDDGRLYLRDSLGNEAAVGTGAGGGINYIVNPDAEASTLGWTTYSNTAGLAPINGTGGTPQANLFIRSTVSPLRGSASFLLDKTGATSRQGQGVSDDFTIDIADRAKILTLTFDYEIGSGTYADNDVSIWILDVTNNVLIQPTNFQIKNAGIQSSHRSSFQSAANSSSYRLIYHVSSVSTLNYALKIDNVRLGPGGTPAVEARLPTIQRFTTGSGTYTRPDGVRYVRIQMVGAGGGGGGSGTGGSGGAGGNGANTTFGTSLLTCNGGVGNINYQGSSTSTSVINAPAFGTASLGGGGTTTGFNISINSAGASGAPTPFGSGGAGGAPTLPGQPGLTNIGSGGGGGGTGGTSASPGGGGGAGAHIDAIIPNPSLTYAFAVGAGGTAGAAGTTGFAGGAGGSGVIEVTEFYSGSDATSNEGRVVAGSFAGNATGTLGAAWNPVTFATVRSDTVGGYSAGTYTVRVPGLYDVYANLYILHASALVATFSGVAIYVNGLLASEGGQYTANTTLTDQRVQVSLKSFQLNVGDTVVVRSFANGTTPSFVNNVSTANTFGISLVQGSQTLLGGESVNASATKNTGSHTSTGNWQDVTSYNTSIADTTGSLNLTTGIYTAAVGGTYQVFGNLGFVPVAAQGFRAARILKNTATITGIGWISIPLANENLIHSYSGIVRLLAGETVRLQGFQASGAGLNYADPTDINTTFNVLRIGN